LDDAISKTQRVIEQLQLIKKAMLQLLTRGISNAFKRYKISPFGEIPEHWQLYRLDKVTEQQRKPISVLPDSLYREIGVRSHGNGVFHKDPVKGLQLGNKRVFQVEPGCLVVNIVFAWEGAVAATSSSEASMIASHRFPMFKPKHELVDVHFLRLLFQTERGIKIMAMNSPGGAGRNKTLNQEEFRRIEVPVPPINEQRLLVSAVMNVEADLQIENSSKIEMERIKHGLMSMLLTGERRVVLDIPILSPSIPRQGRVQLEPPATRDTP
jgi:type I restriction enzyme S subunit